MTLRLDCDKEGATSAQQDNGRKGIMLDSIYQDNMVFQRGVSNPVFGYGVPFSRLHLTFGENELYALTARDGRFTFRIPPMSAAEGLELTITDEKNGLDFKLRNVAVGDVYLISGQSNMEVQLKSCIPGPSSLSDEDYQHIRYIKIPQSSFYGPQTCFGGNWQVAERKNADVFSGIGFFFASKLAKLNGVTIGIVDSSLGGLNIESWISRGTLLTLPHYRDDLLEYEKVCSAAATSEKATESTGLPDFAQKFNDGLAKLFADIPEDEGEKNGYHLPDFDDSQWDTMQIPDAWTLAGHNHAGYFWFRYDIELPADAADREWTLNLGMIDKADRSFFNGQLVGTIGKPEDMSTFDTIRSYAIPKGLARAGRNTIAVLVTSVVSCCEDGGLLGPAEIMNVTSGQDCIPISGVWRYKETYDAGTIGMTFMMNLGYGAPQSFSMFYDNMIKPLSGFQFSGAIWYQGEANAICKANIYREALVAMIQDWRRAFENATMPFYIIQLPEYCNPHLLSPFSQWALMREAEEEAATETDSQLVVTLGAGDVVDIHPKNKKAVGDYIAAMEHDRQQGYPCHVSPRLVGVTASNGALWLEFKCLAPLASTNGTKEVNGFAIAGADGIAYPATCTIVAANTLRISSPQVAAPAMAWYGWGDNPMPYATLCDEAGIPASPFRCHVSGDRKQAVTSTVIHRP